MKLFLIVALALTLYASSREHEEHHINKDVSHLELSSGQTEDFKAILKKYQHEMREFRAFKETINARKKALFLEETLDLQALNELNRTLYENATKEENKLLLRIHKILTPPQRKAFIRYFEEWEVQ